MMRAIWPPILAAMSIANIYWTIDAIKRDASFDVAFFGFFAVVTTAAFSRWLVDE